VASTFIRTLKPNPTAYEAAMAKWKATVPKGNLLLSRMGLSRGRAESRGKERGTRLEERARGGWARSPSEGAYRESEEREGEDKREPARTPCPSCVWHLEFLPLQAPSGHWQKPKWSAMKIARIRKQVITQCYGMREGIRWCTARAASPPVVCALPSPPLTGHYLCHRCCSVDTSGNGTNLRKSKFCPFFHSATSSISLACFTHWSEPPLAARLCRRPLVVMRGRAREVERAERYCLAPTLRTPDLLC
jgi:hypothetical protein